ncbi:MAG: thioredoxin fold domain-containing protein [Ferruginibacter sp.]
MKNSIIFLLVICFSFSCYAQPDSLPVYKRFPNVPPFKLRTVPDSLLYTKDDLPKKKPVIVMVFSPDCEHCQLATKDLLSHIKLFDKVEIVMASSLDYGNILAFYKEFNIAAYPNIVMGRDPSYFLGTFFSIRNFPSIYIYNKKGKFIKEFEGSVSFEKIAEWLK